LQREVQNAQGVILRQAQDKLHKNFIVAMQLVTKVKNITSFCPAAKNQFVINKKSFTKKSKT